MQSIYSLLGLFNAQNVCKIAKIVSKHGKTISKDAMRYL